MKNKLNIATLISIILFVFYLSWQYGRAYGKEEAIRFVETDNAYNYYLLKNCLKGE